MTYQMPKLAEAAPSGWRAEARRLLFLLWALIRNPPAVWLNDDGTVFDEEHLTRREQYQMFKPLWFATVFTRKLACGCTRRRWTGRLTLMIWDCPEHGLLDVPEESDAGSEEWEHR